MLLNGVGRFKVVRKVLKPLEKVLERPCVSQQSIYLNLVVVFLMCANYSNSPLS